MLLLCKTTLYRNRKVGKNYEIPVNFFHLNYPVFIYQYSFQLDIKKNLFIIEKKSRLKCRDIIPANLDVVLCF